MPNIVACTLSTTIQKTILFPALSLGEVNRSASYRLDASGKAVNLARVLSEIDPGCAVTLCPVGEENADDFLSLARRDGLDVRVVRVPGLTRHCYTLLSPDGAGFSATELVVSEPVADGEGARDAFSRAGAMFLGELDRLLDGADALAIAGSRPASYPADLYARACSLARERGVACMADFHGADLSAAIAAACPRIIKINEEEFLGTFGDAGVSGGASSKAMDEPDLIRLVEATSARLGAAIVVTRGPRDVIASDSGVSVVAPVVPVTPVNVIGCGDSFSAGFLHAWVSGGGLSRALAEGVRCAALNARSIRPGSLKPWSPA